MNVMLTCLVVLALPNQNAASVSFETKTPLFCVAFDSTGKKLVTGSKGGTISVFDVGKKERTHHFQMRQRREVYIIGFCDDGKSIILGQEGSTVTFWDVVNSREINTQEVPIRPLALLHTKKDHVIAGQGDGGKGIVWDIQKKQVRNLLPTKHLFLSLAFHPQLKWIAISSAPKRPVEIWDLQSAKKRCVLDGHGGQNVHALSVSRNAKLLASGGNDKKVILWEMDKKKMQRLLQGASAPISSLAFSVDGKRIAAGEATGYIRVWDVKSGKLLASRRPHRSIVWCLRFSPNGELIASVSDQGRVNILNVKALLKSGKKK